MATNITKEQARDYELQGTTRVCSRCKIEQPLDKFQYQPSCKLGHYGVCKRCRADSQNCFRARKGKISIKFTRAEALLMEQTGEQRRCTDCGELKLLSEYYIHPRNTSGHGRQCKSCHRAKAVKRRANDLEKHRKKSRDYRAKNLEHVKAKSRERYKKNPDKWRDGTLRAKYGITLEEYNRRYAEQGGKCAVCKLPPNPKNIIKTLAVDHDHETGAVRGLLCGWCNTGLGQFQDSPLHLFNTVPYLCAGTVN